MRFVDNQGITDPRINLALEEYLLRHVQTDDDLLLFYINEPAVIIGRNQNTIEEIDPNYIEANNVHVVRRLSGGGAVYHDLGNLNFSFITNNREDIHNFAKFIDPVVEVLNGLGVPAELQGKSDVFVEGKKISGNAQFASGNRMFSHGTILFDTNLHHMLQAINPRQNKIESNAVQSIRRFVTNVREWLPEGHTIEQLKLKILDGIFGDTGVQHYPLSEADWGQVNKIADSRYKTWEWNVGRSPQYGLRNFKHLPIGLIDVHLDVAQGVIGDIKIFGSFTGQKDITELQELLTGLRHNKQTLASALDEVDLAAYFGEIDVDEFLNLLY